ncbi:MAG TPA: hypothetical protein VEH84_01845 [Alphaproteobacteria bacterium]|nr:hypothetical protein [Alphaproteobacteria bacterium]
MAATLSLSARLADLARQEREIEARMASSRALQARFEAVMASGDLAAIVALRDELAAHLADDCRAAA